MRPAETGVVMHVAEVHRLVDAVIAVDQTATRSMIETGLGDVARLLAWGQAQQMRLAGYARTVTPCPEHAVAGSRIGLPAASKLLEDVRKVTIRANLAREE